MDHGSFVFRDESDGCLTSKYMNDSVGPFTECCTLIKSVENPQDAFCGSWHSVWLQNKGKQGDAILKIERQKTNTKLFELTWTDKESNILFRGVGMLYETFLVGSYWDK